MNAPLMILALTMGGGFGPEYPHLAKQPHNHTLRAEVGRKIHYHKRSYYGFYQRPWYDYRTQFDYPWCAGPSRHAWPIPAPWSPLGPEIVGLEEEALLGPHDGHVFEQQPLPVSEEVLPADALPAPEARLRPRSDAKEISHPLPTVRPAAATTIIIKKPNPLR